MRIAIFDHDMSAANAVGGCHLQIAQGLAAEHEFVVFAPSMEPSTIPRVRWVKVPVLRRPAVALFLSFHVMAMLIYWMDRVRTGKHFDLIQIVETNLVFGNLSYAHFCHRAYLQKQGRELLGGGIRAKLRWLDHVFRSALEPLTYRRVRSIVVPSRGAAEELNRWFPVSKGKTRVIPNPLDLDRLSPPEDLDRRKLRADYGYEDSDLVLLFAALGHFERKGLPQLMEAIAANTNAELKLMVVGGTPDLVAIYERQAAQLGASSRIMFLGWQMDIRPFLWLSDALVLPSAYETFSLIVHEGAAANLPVIAPSLHGVEELLEDGLTGILIEPTVAGISAGLRQLIALDPSERRNMGAQARKRVGAFGIAAFVDAWREHYRQMCEAEPTDSATR